MGSFNRYYINVKQMKQNVNAIKEKVGDVKLCAVVKADGYGLGVNNICNILSPIVDYFAVANIQEALEIRLFDKITPILVLGVIDEGDYCLAAENNIDISVDNAKQIVDIESNKSIKIHIQINSGMNRLGLKSNAELRKLMYAVKKHQGYKICGVYSHFAVNKNNKCKYILQKNEFILKIAEYFAQYSNNNALFHIDASTTVTGNFADFEYNFCKDFNNNKSTKSVFKKCMLVKNVLNKIMQTYKQNDKYYKYFDMVRIGFALFGGSKMTKPIITIKAKIIKIFQVNKGEEIGYEPSYVAGHKMKIGIVSIGYADGFSRRLSNNFKVLVNGEFVNVIGLVCMDMFFVDITKVKAHLFDDVTILGKDGDREITLSDYASVLKTNHYEILTMFRRKRMNVIIE